MEKFHLNYFHTLEYVYYYLFSHVIIKPFIENDSIRHRSEKASERRLFQSFLMEIKLYTAKTLENIICMTMYLIIYIPRPL